jgi:hypothetical protein
MPCRSPCGSSVRRSPSSAEERKQGAEVANATRVSVDPARLRDRIHDRAIVGPKAASPNAASVTDEARYQTGKPEIWLMEQLHYFRVSSIVNRRGSRCLRGTPSPIRCSVSPPKQRKVSADRVEESAFPDVALVGREGLGALIEAVDHHVTAIAKAMLPNVGAIGKR